MELQDYLNVVRKRWRTIAFATLAVLGLAAVYTVLSPKVYASTTQFFVSTSGSDVSQLQQGNTFTQARVKSYSQLIETPKVLTPVIEELGLDSSPESLAQKVTSTVPLDTVLIEVVHVHLNLNVTVGHDTTVGDFVTVNPGATVSGDVRLEDGVMVGTNAAILQGLTLGAGAVLGGGAVAVKNVDAGITAVGVPARPR